MSLFQNQYLHVSFAQIVGADEAIMPATNNDSIVGVPGRERAEMAGFGAFEELRQHVSKIYQDINLNYFYLIC